MRRLTLETFDTIRSDWITVVRVVIVAVTVVVNVIRVIRIVAIRRTRPPVAFLAYDLI